MDLGGGDRPNGLVRPLLALVAIAAALFVTAVPAPLNPDENNYLATVIALRSERVTVPGTEELPPSPEVLWFDPIPRSRQPVITPAAPTAPPLYAPLALPFLRVGGWRGLIALQVFAFVGCGLLVFAHASRFARREYTPWLALAAFALGSYTLEYAQGLWPHLMAMMLVVTAWVANSRARESGSASVAFVSGILIGTASGIRYQILGYAAILGVVLALWSVRRLRTIAGYLAGVAGPLLASAVINLERLGAFHPATKGATYLTPGRSRAGFLYDALASTWARVVDFTSWPPVRGTLHELQFLYQYDWETNAYVLWGGLKKSWLQSSPWLGVVLVALVLVWFRRHEVAPAVRRELRALSLPVFGVVAMFAAFGFSRSDGGCLNQRYLLEAMPLASVAFALALDRFTLGWRPLLAGSLVGALGAGLLVSIEIPLPRLGSELSPPATSTWIAIRELVELKLPIALAGALALSVFFSDLRGGRLMWTLVGAALAWALVIHVFEDLAGSRAARGRAAERLDAVAAVLPADRPAAIFAFWGHANALGPLALERDLHILQPWADQWADMRWLAGHFHARGRRVYVLCEGLLPQARALVLYDLATEVTSERPCLVRLLPP
jgi:hypothetical protein